MGQVALAGFKSRPFGNPKPHRLPNPRHQHTQVGPERLNIAPESVTRGPAWPPLWCQVGPMWPSMRPLMADQSTSNLPMDRPKCVAPRHHQLVDQCEQVRKKGPPKIRSRIGNCLARQFPIPASIFQEAWGGSVNILASPSPQKCPKSRSVGPAEQGPDQNSGLRQAVWSEFRYFQIALIRVCNPSKVQQKLDSSFKTECFVG